MAVLLFFLDKWIDSRYLLGSKIEGKLVEGKSFYELFDDSPVCPDKIVIYPIEGVASLIYESYKTLWHYYPHVEIVTNGRLIDHCFVSKNEVR